MTLQIIQTASTKLISASRGLCLFLEITDITHDQSDGICWRKITNNDKEQQWSLCLTYSAKSSFSENWLVLFWAGKQSKCTKSNFRNRSWDLQPWWVLRYYMTWKRNYIKLRWGKDTYGKKNLWINKINLCWHLKVLTGLDIKKYKAGQQSSSSQPCNSIIYCMLKVLSLLWTNLILKAFSLSWKQKTNIAFLIKAWYIIN